MTVERAVWYHREVQWHEGPPARLRHSLTEANLLRHLPTSPQRVLDVAGGNGKAAVRLAVLGHEVTVLDPAGVMLSNAKEQAEAFDVADRVHVVQANADDTPELFGAGDFDVVLCHNLLQYVEDRRSTLMAVLAPLRGGGLLSVLGPNSDAVPLHSAIRRLDPRRALRELDSDLLPPSGNGLGQACPAAEVVGHLVELGVGLISRYGVHCVSDYLVDEHLVADPDFYADLERLELALSERMPYLLTARYFHLIAHV